LYKGDTADVAFL